MPLLFCCDQTWPHKKSGKVVLLIVNTVALVRDGVISIGLFTRWKSRNAETSFL